MKSIKTIEPRFAETDQMGIIHHSVYPIWYEIGRLKFCQDMGMPYTEIIKHEINMALIHLDVDYIKPVRLDDLITIETTLIEMSKVKMVFAYEIYTKDHVLVNRGSTKLAWLDQHLKPLNLQKSLPHIYAHFSQVVTKIDHRVNQ
ncbi:MAG: acyl-CoA thioesterase [Acholeplasmataceae bacterium]